MGETVINFSLDPNIAEMMAKYDMLTKNSIA